MGVYAHSMLQVFGVDEQEPLCVSRLAGADQRQRIAPQWSGTGDGGKHGHLEREVEALSTPPPPRPPPSHCGCFQSHHQFIPSCRVFPLQVLPEELVVGGPRWVSQWATLAASHVRTDPEGSGGESHVMVAEQRGS